MKLKFFEEKIITLLMILATVIVFGFFASIIWTIART